MPAKHYIDNEKNIILTVWEGPAIDVDFIEAVKLYQKNIQSAADYIGYNEVVDFTKTTRIKLTTAGIKGLAQVTSMTDKNEVSTKLALIVSSNLAFGLARMYEAYRGLSRNAIKEVRVFKSSNEAYTWIDK